MFTNHSDHKKNLLEGLSARGVVFLSAVIPPKSVVREDVCPIYANGSHLSGREENIWGIKLMK